MITKIWRHIYHYFSIARYPFYRMFYSFPKVQSIEETLKNIIDNKRSIARFGDGELSMLHRNDIGFQNYNVHLKKRLQEIIVDYNNENCLVGIPSSLQGLNGFTNEAKDMFKSLIGGYYNTYRRFLDFNHIYPNSFITRCYMDCADKRSSIKYFDMLKQIWHDRNIVILEGEYTRFGVGNDFLDNAKSVNRIIVPSKNAFDQYELILETLKQKINGESLILAAMGPTATVICYDLSQLGYQAIDIGHADIEYEWFLQQSLTKNSIDGKFVNEVSSDNPLRDINNKKYENQIIIKIL